MTMSLFLALFALILIGTVAIGVMSWLVLYLFLKQAQKMQLQAVDTWLNDDDDDTSDSGENPDEVPTFSQLPSSGI